MLRVRGLGLSCPPARLSDKLHRLIEEWRQLWGFKSERKKEGERERESESESKSEREREIERERNRQRQTETGRA